MPYSGTLRERDERRRRRRRRFRILPAVTLRSLPLALLLALGASIVRADALSDSRFSLSAFGTLGATYQNAHGLAYRRNIGQGHGARAGEVDLGTDSILGLQVTGRITSGFDAVAQGTVNRNEDGVWRPQLKRGFLRYQPDPSLMIRAGRIGLGLYLLGDAFDVGYGYLTIRPPVEVYGLLAADEFNGIDATFSRTLGGGVGRIRLLGGRWPFDVALADGTTATIGNDSILGITADYLIGDWQTRAALVQIHLPGRGDPVAPALAQTGFPQAVALAGELNRPQQNSYGAEIGTTYEGDPLQVSLVYVHLNSDYLQGPKFNSALVLLGYRIGQLTPYTEFAMTDNFGPARATGLPPLPAFEPLIAAAREDQVSSQNTQRDFSLGLRYDFAPHVDLKAQIDRVWLHQSELIFDYNAPPPGHTSLTVYGVAVDFAF